MARTVAERLVRPSTVDMVMAMLDAGIIPGDNRLELLDGALTEKPVKGGPHEEVKRRLLLWLDPSGNAQQFDVLVEAGLVVPDRISLPQPDLMVAPPTRDRLARLAPRADPPGPGVEEHPAAQAQCQRGAHGVRAGRAEPGRGGAGRSRRSAGRRPPALSGRASRTAACALCAGRRSGAGARP